MEKCYKDFDREFVFLERDTSNNENGITVFKQVQFRYIQPAKTLKIGNKIKWKANPKSTNWIYGEVVDFVIPERLSPFDVRINVSYVYIITVD